MLQNRNFLVQRYVCISSRGPLPPLDLELYSRASQAMAKDLLAAAAHAREGFSVIVVGSAHVGWELDGHMDPGSTFDVDLFYTIAHPALDS